MINPTALIKLINTYNDTTIQLQELRYFMQSQNSNNSVLTDFFNSIKSDISVLL